MRLYPAQLIPVNLFCWQNLVLKWTLSKRHTWESNLGFVYMNRAANSEITLQFRWAMHSERGGNGFRIKDKSRMLPRILKDSGTTWQPDLELMIPREIFNASEFLIISKVQKLTQSSWSRVELGRCRVLALATSPSQLKSDQQLLCKILLQKSSSIKKEIHLQWADQALHTESCQFSCDKRPIFSGSTRNRPAYVHAETSLSEKPTPPKPHSGSSIFLPIKSALAVPGGFLLSLSPWGMLMAFLCSLVIEQTSCPSRSSHAKSQILTKLHSACRSNVLQELLKVIVSFILLSLI